MSYELRSARWIAADVLRQVVQPGDTVVDATLGNGHDTLMLCELVGETGRVIGFDIQPDAVERTRERLADAGMLSRCTLYAEGHEHLSERVTVPIRTATFNLGWLPGGDKRITTHPCGSGWAKISALKRTSIAGHARNCSSGSKAWQVRWMLPRRGSRCCCKPRGRCGTPRPCWMRAN